MTDTEAFIISWYRRSDQPCGRVVVPVGLIEIFVADYLEMGYEVEVYTFNPGGNHA